MKYVKKLLREIQESLVFSEYLEAFIDHVEAMETVAIALTMDDLEEETPAPFSITPEQQQAISPGGHQFITLKNMHEWLDDVRYGFMYSPPPGKTKNDQDEWLEEWSKVLFDFAKIERKHVIYIQELLDKEPFSKLRTRQKSLLDFSDRLVKKQLAVWIIKKEKLRVYWKSLDEWANAIYDWAYKNVKTEPLFIYDFKEEGEEFSDLPDDEYPEILKILQKQKKGRVIKTSDKKVAFVFEF